MLSFIINKLKIVLFRYHWKRRNQHNKTLPLSLFSIDTVTVGKMSYGGLDVRSFQPSCEKLMIGNYVSIAGNVVFILGGNHQVKTISPFPLYSNLISSSPERDAQTKGPILIEDEVWIGFGAIILSGVTIGKGAIIAAGAVIVNNVPPYAIVGGNPASVIKYRFSDEIIEALKGFSIAQIDQKIIIENIDEFYKQLDLVQLNNIKKLI